MQENNVEINNGKESGGRVLAWCKQYSPFEFATLQEVPWPTWGLVFACLFIVVIARLYEKNVDSFELHSSQVVEKFRLLERMSDGNPVVLHCGSSLINHAVRAGVVAENLNVKTLKVFLGSSSPWEWCRLLQRYEPLLHSVPVITIDLDMRRFVYYVPKTSHERYSILKRFGEPFPYSNDAPPWYSRFLPQRLSLKQIGKLAFEEKKVCTDPLGDVPSYRERDDKQKKRLSKFAHLRQEAEIRGTPFDDSVRMRVDERMIAATHQLVDWCRQKGIHVVILATPMVYGSPYALPEFSTNDIGKKRYLDLLWDLRRKKNCTVVSLRNFDAIYPGIDDAPFFADDYHMLPAGAVIYTQWLSEQMLNDPKIVAALNTPRKPEEFFVKRYARRALRPIVKLLRHWQTPAEKSKPVMVASPPENPVR